MPVILFDFGGTLDGDGLPWVARFHEAYRRAGGARDLADFEEPFRQANHELAAWPGIATLGYRATVETLTELLVPRLPDAAGPRIARDFLADSLAAVERNRPVLEKLAAEHRLGVISNYTGNLVPCLAELGLLGCFQVTLDSTVERVSKPDPILFERALAALGGARADAWMVGDNPEADIRPAARLGLRTCWVAPASRPAPAGLPFSMRVERVADFRCTD